MTNFKQTVNIQYIMYKFTFRFNFNYSNILFHNLKLNTYVFIFLYTYKTRAWPAENTVYFCPSLQRVQLRLQLYYFGSDFI